MSSLHGMYRHAVCSESDGPGLFCGSYAREIVMHRLVYDDFQFECNCWRHSCKKKRRIQFENK